MVLPSYHVLVLISVQLIKQDCYAELILACLTAFGHCAIFLYFSIVKKCNFLVVPVYYFWSCALNNLNWFCKVAGFITTSQVLIDGFRRREAGETCQVGKTFWVFPNKDKWRFRQSQLCYNYSQFITMTFYVMLITLCIIIDFSTFFMSSVNCSQLQSSYCANVLYSHVFANILDKTRNHQQLLAVSRC